MKILDRYIDQLIEQSTPECPVWNIEKIREGSKSTWNYIDGCMIKAIIELFLITRNHRYLDFADAFTGRFVREDGSIESYDPKEYNLDNVNAGKTLFDLYKLTGKEKYRRAMDTVYSQLKEQPQETSGIRKFIPTRYGWMGCTWPSLSICSTRQSITDVKTAKIRTSSSFRYTGG